MNKETLKVIENTYKKNESLIIGDSKPTNNLQKSLNYVKIKYRIIFTKLAGVLADRVISKINKDIAEKIKKDLKSKKLPTSVLDTDSRALRTVKNSLIKANVALIKSIPSKYFEEIEQIVMESVSRGRDLSYMSDELEKRYGVVKRRAQLISRDQNDKITSALNIARQKDLGITKNIWVHSDAGKKPRPSHVKANGKIFDINKGLKIDGEYIFPGQLVNCFPGNQLLTGAPFIEKLFRHWHRGKLTQLVTADGAILQSTPNHPYLTKSGWQRAQNLNIGDDIIKMGGEGVNIIECDKKHMVMLTDIFDTLLLTGLSVFVSRGGQFHGDISNEKVDIIDTASGLPLEWHTDLHKVLRKFGLSDSEFAAFLSLLSFGGATSQLSVGINKTPKSLISGKGSLFAKMWGSLSGRDKIRFGMVARLNIMAQQNFSDGSAGTIKQLSDPMLALTRLVKLDSFQLIDILTDTDAFTRGIYPDLSKVFSDGSGRDIISGADALNRVPHIMKPDKIVDKIVIDFDGHVYNLQTVLGYYTISNLVVSNCRCYSRPILDIEE